MMAPTGKRPKGSGKSSALFYDERDRVAARHGDRRLAWLYELGAKPASEAGRGDSGFIFTGARPIEDYRALVRDLPLLRDRPEEREPLLYLQAIAAPAGFPPSASDLAALRDLGGRVAGAFRSRGVMADFARLARGGWAFIEAGPVSCAGTAHERVFKSVARALAGQRPDPFSDAVGGIFPG